jgi:hypothetical protein
MLENAFIAFPKRLGVPEPGTPAGDTENSWIRLQLYQFYLIQPFTPNPPGVTHDALPNNTT